MLVDFYGFVTQLLYLLLIENDMKGKSEMKKNGWALVPFGVFAVFYVGLSLYADHCGYPMPWYKVPMPIAFIVASAVALGFGKDKLDRKVDVYAAGMGETNIMIMSLIFILAGAFATIAKGSGAVDAAVAIARNFIPSRLMVAGVFLVSCFISTAIGTSCGTIAAVTPIALGFAGPLGLSPAFLIGAVVGGAMFGDNLSMISDTTIAATRTQGVRMKDKFIANFFLALPAALVSLAIYAVKGAAVAEVAAPSIGWQEWVLIIPYGMVLVLALVGFNVMALLFSGSLLSAIIGFALGKFGFFDALDFIGKGTLGMSETLIVAILAGGLFKFVQSEGGFAWLTEKISSLVRGPRSCEAGVGALVGAINCFTANNTVAIVIAGPIARECSERFGANPVRVASVLDTVSCVVQGLIPYGAQILIAIGVARGLDLEVESFELLKCLYYQPLLLVAVVVWLVLGGRSLRKSASA